MLDYFAFISTFCLAFYCKYHEDDHYAPYCAGGTAEDGVEKEKHFVSEVCEEIEQEAHELLRDLLFLFFWSIFLFSFWL